MPEINTQRELDRIRRILTHNLGYVLLHSPLAGKTEMGVQGGTERAKRQVARNG